MTTNPFRFLKGSLLCVGALLLSTSAHAQDPLSPLLSRTFFDLSGLNLPYRLYVPESYTPGTKLPLVLYLHGGGERGTDNLSPLLNGTFALNFLDPSVQAAHPSFFLAPQAPLEIAGGDPRGEYWVNNFPDNLDGTPNPGVTLDTYSIASVPISTSLNAVQNLLPSLFSEFSIDTNRLYVTGWSMGGDATWDLLMRNPGVFAAGAPIAAGGDPTQAAALANTPLWVFQGAQDQAASPSGSQKMVSAIQMAGGDIRYTEFADGDHYIGEQSYTTSGFMDWLFAQSLPTSTAVSIPAPQATPEPVPTPGPTPEPTPVPTPVPDPDPDPTSPTPVPGLPTGQSVPEPGVLGLLALGLLGGTLARRRCG